VIKAIFSAEFQFESQNIFGSKIHTAKFPIDFYGLQDDNFEELKIAATLDKKKRFTPSR
jgi:hypothetical protein